MFLETSHHGNIKFWAKKYPIRKGGKEGEKGVRQKGLFLKKYLPQAIFAILGPLANLSNSKICQVGHRSHPMSN